MSTTVHLRVLTDEPYGTVSPRLYGHFAEHLGRCCYDGIWVGPQSPIPNVDGFRKDIIDALKAMPTPLVRWPGGCYADHYHWRDGIGERTVRLGLSCGRRVLDDNSLGTHEFMRFCELIGAEPYLAGNMGSGSVQELCDWIEYCNCELPTTLAKERMANGHDAPFGVKLWGIGNENWGCGGNYDPESYGLEYRRYSLMVQHVDPSIEMVICGHETWWNQRLLQTMKNHMNFVDHFSIHRYWVNGGPGSAFGEADYYGLIQEAEQTEDFVVETRALIEEVNTNKKKIGIALDEWGVWHPEARTWGPGALASEVTDYTQAGTLRDAIATAVALETFHRQCDSLSLANLAQITNVLHAPLMTEGESFWVTPTYHVLRMHAPHLGATAYKTVVEGTESLPVGGESVSATATSGGITITNRHLSKDATVRISGLAGLVSGEILTADKASDENSASAPSKVAPKSLTIRQEGSETIVELPPHSIATLKVG